MKKYILILLLTVAGYGQTLQNPTFGNTTTNTLKVKTNTESVTGTNKVPVQETDGTVNWIQSINIPIPIVPTNYMPTATTLGGHLTGIDNKLGTIVATTAGVTTRVWFTADVTVVSATNYYTSNATSKGTLASAIQSVVNDDNQKKYFTQDIIGTAFAANTLFPAGIYAGNLSASTTPNSAQQRYTVELYKCDTNGTPIASGITGAPVGSLGVTVVTILDSGLLTLADGSVTNVQVSGNLASPLSMAVGERIRYHVSAEKVGTAASNITQSVYYGTSYNSYLDVPVPLNTTAVQNLSSVTGATTTDALNTLSAADFFKESASTGIGVNVKSIYLGSGVNMATLLVNKPIIVSSAGGWHTIGAYSGITQVGSGAAYASFDSQEIMSGSGNFNHFISFQARNRFTGSGVLDFMAGLDSQIDHAGSGTITDAYGIRIKNKAGAGAVTNLYGLYVQTQVGGTNNYSIVTESGKVHFGDQVTVVGQALLYGKSELISNQAKTVATANQYSYFGKTTETTNYTALSVSQIGGATQDLRQWRFQTIEQGVANEGAIVFQNVGGRVLVGTSTDDGNNKLQVNGNITASAATTSNQVVIKSQLDAAATSGTYTPTLTSPTNITTPTAVASMWSKIGNVVTVRFSINYAGVPSTATASTIKLTLPIARANSTVTFFGSGSGSDSVGNFFSANSTSNATTTTDINFKSVSTNAGSVIVVAVYSILE